MSRPLWLKFHGALYYLTSHGDRRERFFEDDEDRAALLEAGAHGFDRVDTARVGARAILRIQRTESAR
jgi:hypothetical protein